MKINSMNIIKKFIYISVKKLLLYIVTYYKKRNKI